jgi:hypothetical protein
MRRLRAIALLLAVSASACGGFGADAYNPDSARIQTERQLAGVWRMTSYVPQDPLSPAMLLSLQADSILVRFDGGRVQSATGALSFDRAFRVTNVSGRNFKIVIADEDGVEVESHCQWDAGGRVIFQTITAPWIGRGALEREGHAMTSEPR